MIKIKAVGENGKCKWDDKGYSQIHQIFISVPSDGNRILCIQFQYHQNDSLVLSPKYGMDHGPKFYSIELNCPSEFLIRVSGKYHIYSGIMSIMFTTNLKTYGPYGCDKYGTEFDFHMGASGQFGGFHGTFNHFGLQSIGVHVKPHTTITKEVSSDSATTSVASDSTFTMVSSVHISNIEQDVGDDYLVI